MTIDLAQIADKKNIRYFLISFTDLFGVMRSKLVPAQAISAMQKNGAGFAGFATHLDMTPADSDMFAIPDPESLIQLPWKKDVAWLCADLIMDGVPVIHSPREVLKSVTEQAMVSGYVLKTGVECEFFLLDDKTKGIVKIQKLKISKPRTKLPLKLADKHDTQTKPCYDQQALMRQYDFISEICNYMQDMGWNPYQNDHEDGNGQFEMNWEYADCLTTANRHAFFKFMLRSVAEKHGLRASFMPKPFAGITGSGCHIHFSLWDKSSKKNLFIDKKGEMGLSNLAYNFLGGVLDNASALCAITNPTVNSYKRINAQVTSSGSTWSPNSISYSGNNRTHLVRIPDNDRFELRLPDGAANPYLLPAVLLAAGLDGIREKKSAGKRLDNNMYTNPPADAKKLPQTLHEALNNLDKSKILRNIMGQEFIDSYLKLKRGEWSSYMGSISEWEQKNYLDV